MDRHLIDSSSLFPKVNYTTVLSSMYPDEVPVATYDQIATELTGDSTKTRGYVSLETTINNIDSSIDDLEAKHISNKRLKDDQIIKIGNDWFKLKVDSFRKLWLTGRINFNFYCTNCTIIPDSRFLKNFYVGDPIGNSEIAEDGTIEFSTTRVGKIVPDSGASCSNATRWVGQHIKFLDSSGNEPTSISMKQIDDDNYLYILDSNINVDADGNLYYTNNDTYNIYITCDLDESVSTIGYYQFNDSSLNAMTSKTACISDSDIEDGQIKFYLSDNYYDSSVLGVVYDYDNVETDLVVSASDTSVIDDVTYYVYESNLNILKNKSEKIIINI